MYYHDLFAGPGGWDIAARDLGLVGLGFEWDADAVETRLAEAHPTVHGDVRDYSPFTHGRAEMLKGSPPCQTFSPAGNGDGRRNLDRVLFEMDTLRSFGRIRYEKFEDERTGLVLEPLRWLLEAHDAGVPYRHVVLEEVAKVLPVWDAYKRVLNGIGYNVDTGVLEAEFHDVPQARRRAVLVGSLDFSPTLPTPAATPRTVLDVLPERKGWSMKHWRGAGMAERHGLRPSWPSTRPAMTITGHPARLLWVHDETGETQRLSVRDAALLQTFPEGYRWAGGSRSRIFKQIGNAVPPALGKAVLKQFAERD